MSVGTHGIDLSASITQPRIALLTMSFRGDLEMARLLCETADRFVPPEMAHVLAVPARDVPLFRPLAGTRRTIVPQESLAPKWLRRLPLPSPRMRRLLRLPRRDVYAMWPGRFVRGWIAQQLMKIAATARAEADIVLHVDSDVAFVRRLTIEHLVEGGRMRFLRTAGAGDTPMHRPWHAAASTLLGLPPSTYHGADYIGNLTTWRPPVVAAMLAQIREVTGQDPMAALAATHDVSEYVLYGAYCEHVLGLERSGHAPTSRLLCATVWPGQTPASLEAQLVDLTLEDDQVAVGIQSTVPVSIEQRRAIAERLIARG